MATGRISPNEWLWEGDPNNAPLASLNVPKGGQVTDTLTGNLYIKKTELGVAGGYELDALTGDAVPEAPEDGKQYARQDGAWVEVEPATAAPTELMLEEDYVLPAPEGTFVGGDKVKFHIHAVGADRNLKFGSGIAIPTDSSFDNAVGKTLLEGRVYVVQLEYLCSSQWGLTTLVGGYY